MISALSLTGLIHILSTDLKSEISVFLINRGMAFVSRISFQSVMLVTCEGKFHRTEIGLRAGVFCPLLLFSKPL